MDRVQVDHSPWPARGWFLPVIGAVLGLIVNALLDRGDEPYGWTQDPLRIAAAGALVVGGVTFGLTLERRRWTWSIAFAAGVAIVAGAVFYWNGSPAGGYSSDGWQIVSIIVAIAIAAPLFQSARDHGRWSPGYSAVHGYAWGNIVLWCAGVAFGLVSYLLAHMIGELFSLIGMTFVRDIVRNDWFGLMLGGAALATAFAILRDRDKVLDNLQRIVMTILSVLAPVLAVGLALFLLSLPFTGLQPLWDRTTATTPVLLGCVISALILANAIVGNDQEEESRSRLLRVSALVLAMTILPLTAVAFASTWLRVDQHGFTPERLWALVFVAVGLVAGIAYALALVLGPRDWMAMLRRVNLQLALFVCLLALVLALPAVNFGAISTRNQIARLEAGKIAPEQFDWAALAFDFGPSGKAATRRFAQDASRPALRQEARRALATKSRWELAEPFTGRPSKPLAGRLKVRPAQIEVPATLLAAVARPGVCGSEGRCDLFWSPGKTMAVAVRDLCAPEDAAREQAYCDYGATVLIERAGEWRGVGDPGDTVPVDVTGDSRARNEQRAAVARGEVEVREVTRRQLYIGGTPVGTPFE